MEKHAAGKQGPIVLWSELVGLISTQKKKVWSVDKVVYMYLM
jgi:hypothetical protein